jgi:GT2 family glycosyltransferase
MTPPPYVAVLTLNWNGRAWLAECVRSLLALEYPNFDVTVIDNASTDGSQALVRRDFPGVRLLENPRNLGYGPALNVGLKDAAARGAEFFLIVNNDAVIDPGALEALMRTALSCPRAGYVTGKVYWYAEPDVLQSVGKPDDPTTWLTVGQLGRGERDEGQHAEVVERAFVDDAYVLVSRGVYDDVGGYDSGLFLQAEEFDWQARARRRGWRVFYTPHARLWHHGSLSMGGPGSPTSQFFYIRNIIVVMARHVGRGPFTRFYTTVAWMTLSSLAKGLIRRPPTLPSRVAAVLGFLDGTRCLIRPRPITGTPPGITWLQRRAAKTD